MLQHCRDAGVFAVELPGKDHIQRLNAMFRRLESRLGQPELSLDDAFQMAIELESSEINDIYSRLTAPIEKPAYVMRKKIELSVVGHFQRLQEAACKFKASTLIQTRLTELLSHCSSESIRAMDLTSLDRRQTSEPDVLARTRLHIRPTGGAQCC
jgi:hypothetical protein